MLEFITILPTLNKYYLIYLKKGFDPADVSLLEYSDKYLILTEDHPMLLEGITDRRNIIQLADYLGDLYLNDFLTAKEFYHLIRTFRKWRNIKKKKEKQLLALLHNKESG